MCLIAKFFWNDWTDLDTKWASHHWPLNDFWSLVLLWSETHEHANMTEGVWWRTDGEQTEHRSPSPAGGGCFEWSLGPRPQCLSVKQVQLHHKWLFRVSNSSRNKGVFVYLCEAALGESDQLLVSRRTDVQSDRKQSLESSDDQRRLEGISIPSLLHLLPLLVRYTALSTQPCFISVCVCVCEHVWVCVCIIPWTF